MICDRPYIDDHLTSGQAVPCFTNEYQQNIIQMKPCLRVPTPESCSFVGHVLYHKHPPPSPEPTPSVPLLVQTDSSTMNFNKNDDVQKMQNLVHLCVFAHSTLY